MMVKEDGYALFLVLIILTIFALLFPAVLRLTITEFMIAKNYQESISDYYLIEGIVDLGVSEAYNGLDKLEYISQANLQLLCNNEKSLEIIDSSNHKLTVKYKILEIVDESSKVNINIASKEMLASLDEIGESIAEDIIAKRDFNTIEELSQVSGIGNAGGESESKTYENIKAVSYTHLTLPTKRIV